MRHRPSKCVPMYGFHPNVADAVPAARAPSLIASVFPGRPLSRRLARCRVPRNRNIWVKTAQKRSRKACPRHASNRETSTDVSRETFGGLGWCHRSSAAPPGRNAAAKGGGSVVARGDQPPFCLWHGMGLVDDGVRTAPTDTARDPRSARRAMQGAESLRRAKRVGPLPALPHPMPSVPRTPPSLRPHLPVNSLFPVCQKMLFI